MHDRHTTAQHFSIRVHEGTEFESVTCPEWAQRIASEISEGARVRLGHRSRSTMIVEVVLVKRTAVRDRDHAETVAERIVEAVEG